MSSSRHNKTAKIGRDWGARYNCDRHYSGTPGVESKKLARKERRTESAKTISWMLNYE